MGNAAGSMEVPQGKEGKTVLAPPGSSGSQKRTAGLKLPMPPEEELEQRFGAVLVSCDFVQQVRAHVNFHVKRKEHKANSSKKQRIWNMLEMCTSSGQAYHSARYTMPLWKDT